MKDKAQILLVEDDPNLNMVIKDYLQLLGYDIEVATDGKSGLNKFDPETFDLALLDVMLPEMDGFTLAEKIREIDSQFPIIFLTAKNMEEDRVKGFRLGADDYITKPFSTEELSLRIQAVMKRYHSGKVATVFDDEIYRIGNFVLDYTNLSLKHKEDSRKLTRKEGELLRLLCQYKNRTLNRKIALQQIWGTEDYFVGRSMDVFVTKLRKYLRPDPRVAITNVHGTGFRLEVEDSE